MPIKLTLPLSVILVLSIAPAIAQTQRPPTTLYYTRHSPDGDHFYIARYQLLDENEANITGYKVSKDRLPQGDFPLTWVTKPDLRSYLLVKGYIYDTAKPPPRPTPTPTPTTSQSNTSEGGDVTEESNGKGTSEEQPKGPGFWTLALRFLGDNLGIVLAFLSLPVLGWVAKICVKALWEWRYNRSVEMVYCGLPASGKTALIARLRHPDLPAEHFDQDNTTRKLEEKRHDPISKSGVRFHPTAVDIPGSKPSLFLERLLVSKRFHSRRVVLVVLAPFGMQSSEQGVDEGFVRTQSGYIFGLVDAVITSTKLPKPDTVVAFMNKSDLFADGNDAFAAAFKNDIDRIALMCKNRGIKFLKVKGSARTGAGTKGMMDSIVENLGA